MPNPGAFEHKVLIQATGMQVLFAFVDPEAIKAWWSARNAVVEPRPGGLLVVEWERGQGGEDPLLGALGGVLAGVLDRSQAGHFVHFGSLHWLTPRGETFGPTRLEITVQSKGNPREKPALLSVVGSAYRSDPRWDRYFELAERGWARSIQELKRWCEAQAPPTPEPRVMGLGDSYLAEAILQRRRIS
jgi:uncharacterized protein YndB with AHSA1/START domain